MTPLERLAGARKIGLLFSGGAARCIFQVGVVETLYELGVTPAMCLGVSGGVWNAAAVAVGNWARLRAYWRYFSRMPAIDLSNLFREHSPFIWSRIHERAFRRYIGVDRLRRETTLPVYAGVTRLRDRTLQIRDLRSAPDPLQIMLASNYLPPFYTHAPVIDGERFGDGGFVDNLPYEALFDRGCDLVVAISQKGECEGGLFRHIDDPDHVIPEQWRDRVIVIRPRHQLDISFAERSWTRLSAISAEGAARAREVLGAEGSLDTASCSHSRRPTWYLSRLRRMLFARRIAPASLGST